MRNIIAITIIVLLLANTGYSGTYYIDGTSGLDTNPGTIASPWKTINKANTTLVAGDIVYIRGGTYTIGVTRSTTEGIRPSNSGTSGNPIVYTVYGDEVVNLVGQADQDVDSRGIWIHAKNYIKVDGKSLGQFNLFKMKLHLLLGPWPGNPASNSTSYNEICYITCDSSYLTTDWSHTWQGSLICDYTTYNHIHHCKFSNHGVLGTGEGESDGNLFDLGTESANEEDEISRYNVVENCEFSQGAHATFGYFGDHNIVRNNYFHNEGWYNINGTLYGYRNIIGDGADGYVGYSIFEGNRIGHAAPNYTWPGKNYYWGGTGFKLCHPYNIVRYNAFFNNTSDAMTLAKYSGLYNAKGHHNYIYNNTYYYNGHYTKLPYEDVKYWRPFVFAYIGDDDWNVFYGSVLKNNLFYNNGNVNIPDDIWALSGNATLADVMNPAKGNVTILNNFNDDEGENTDPLFVDETLSRASSWTLPNLNLSNSSPAINQGTYLTQAHGSGSGTTKLVVDDARYFQDGNFGKGTLAWPSSVKIYADWIAIGTYENIVQINSIDYSTNTITLASLMTWKDRAPIWLYKKSDGVQVLYGNGPDVGAYENENASASKLDVPPQNSDLKK